MFESKAIGAKERLSAQQAHKYEPDRDTPFGQMYLAKEQVTQPLIGQPQPDPKNAPSWLRPFLSLRVQLTLAYTLLTILVAMFSYLLFYRQSSSPFTMLTVLGIILIASAIAFGLTTLLLRPLFRITDAAQAIAIGDLAQRDRLPLRLPPQDEIDRLAGSLNEMVIRLEHAEASQQASQTRFRQFFSDASHQLRTPLTSIRGFTELLIRGAKDDPETSQRILTRMRNESERMTLLINDLLTLARLDDIHPIKTQYIDLIDLAVEGIEQTRSRATDDRNVSLQIATEEKLGIQADRERIKQLIFILLDNALKYGRSAPDGQITLKLDRQNNQIVLCVYDNGEGIAEEDLEHIFETFYRGRHRSSTQPTVIGTGLGLTIASAIVRAHNGSITVCSEPGNTEFKVLLPCAG